VISHGNYRKELFLKVSTGVAFERSLFEAVARCGWKLHALPEDFQTNGAGRALPRGFSFDPWTPGQSDGNEYAEHLEIREQGNSKHREVLAKRYCSRRFIGGKEEKKALIEGLREKHPDVV